MKRKRESPYDMKSPILWQIFPSLMASSGFFSPRAIPVRATAATCIPSPKENPKLRMFIPALWAAKASVPSFCGCKSCKEILFSWLYFQRTYLCRDLLILQPPSCNGFFSFIINFTAIKLDSWKRDLYAQDHCDKCEPKTKGYGSTVYAKSRKLKFPTYQKIVEDYIYY